MPFRFLRYDASIILRHLEQGNKKLPILQNVLFYTGSRPWKASAKFDDYYEDPAIGAKYLHVEEFAFIQLEKEKHHSAYIDKDLGYCLAAFKCGMKRNKAYEEFKKFKEIPAFRDYFNNLPRAERILAGSYIAIFVGDSKEEQENLLTLIVINEQEKEDIMRSLAQKYRDEGIEIGQYRGIEKGIEKVAQNMLFNLHLDLDTVQKATGLTPKDLQQILKKEKNWTKLD
jgi:predicted transposase/invertase (TIGR01784 family)